MTKRKILSAFFATIISIGMMLLPCTVSAAENSGTQDGKERFKCELWISRVF